MKREIKNLLKNKPEATKSDLNAEEIMLVVKAISNQQAGLSSNTEVYKIECFLKNWLTVDAAVGYIVRNGYL